MQAETKDAAPQPGDGTTEPGVSSVKLTKEYVILARLAGSQRSSDSSLVLALCRSCAD